MTTADVHGPIDFVLIEFSAERLTGGAAQALLDLVDKGIVTLYDVLVVGKTDDGGIYALDIGDDVEQVGGFAGLAWVRSGLLTEDDMRDAAETMLPGTLAVLIVYENTWAVPFVAAARESGGELIASARIPAQDVMDALDALEATEVPESRQPVAATPSGA
ncbi:DUF1269 domain-containing protein [Blastococcus sp. CT_GayMR20]|uniref:DUF6325 family protein n=1 Tax=Blastococcus sp. CT_GayMR20 TaxID=2559609 RepID=UPI001073982D|nr:DUF6325 family protein [Blastococcus sp. CT_GayMR20]TFV92978.1 DUF1269 domain-containing protein [Blastococcus sp. CT_GayMR20]